MNLEELFVKKYEELQLENLALKAALAEKGNAGRYGVFFENAETKAITVSALDYYSMFEYSWTPNAVRKYDADGIARLIEDGDLKEFTRLHLVDIVATPVIAKITKKVPGSERILYLTDGDRLIEIDRLEEDCDPDSLVGSFIFEEDVPAVSDAAVKKVKEELADRLQKLRQSEEDQ